MRMAGLRTNTRSVSRFSPSPLMNQTEAGNLCGNLNSSLVRIGSLEEEEEFLNQLPLNESGLVDNLWIGLQGKRTKEERGGVKIMIMRRRQNHLSLNSNGRKDPR